MSVDDQPSVDDLQARIEELEAKVGGEDGGDSQSVGRRQVLAGGAGLLGLGGLLKSTGRARAAPSGHSISVGPNGEGTFNGGQVDLADTSSSPASAGQFRRNGSDVEVYSGGGVKNLSNIGSGTGGIFEDTNGDGVYEQTTGDGISTVDLLLNGVDPDLIDSLGTDGYPLALQTGNGVRNRAIALQVASDEKEDPEGGTYNGYAAALDWLSTQGDRVARFTAEPSDNHLHLYMHQDPSNVPYDGSDPQPVPHSKFDISGGTHRLTVGGGASHGTFDTSIRAIPGGGPSTAFSLHDNDGAKVQLEHRSTLGEDGITRLYDWTDGTNAFRYDHAEKDLYFRGVSVRGLREVGAQPSAGDLREQEWAFSSDVDGSGNAAWLFKDQSGTAHYLQTDGVL